jgi:hypothetical protein
MAEHRFLVPGARARTRRAIREYSAGVATAELPANSLVQVDSCAWADGRLHVAVVALEGALRGHVAIVQGGELVVEIDVEADG